MRASLTVWQWLNILYSHLFCTIWTSVKWNTTQNQWEESICNRRKWQNAWQTELLNLWCCWTLHNELTRHELWKSQVHRDVKQNSTQMWIYIRRRERSTKTSETMCQMQTTRSLYSELSDRLVHNSTVRHSHNEDFHASADTADRA